MKRLFPLIIIIIGCGIILNAQQTGPNNPDYCRISRSSKAVDLLTGDLHYSLSLFEIPVPEGGYSLDLNYLSGITYDQEASWVGLGWSMFPGAITRNVNGYPDDCGIVSHTLTNKITS